MKTSWFIPFFNFINDIKHKNYHLQKFNQQRDKSLAFLILQKSSSLQFQFRGLYFLKNLIAPPLQHKLLNAVFHKNIIYFLFTTLTYFQKTKNTKINYIFYLSQIFFKSIFHQPKLSSGK